MIEVAPRTEPGPAPRGRPRGTSVLELETIALRLFTERGYDEVTIDDLAAEAGISKRTFHRYFPAKAAVLWQGFDDEVAELRRVLDSTPPERPTLTAIRDAVVAVNRHRPEDQPDLRARLDLIVHSPQIRAAAGERYEAWEQAVTAFVRGRHPDADPLLAPSVGRSTLAVCRTAFELWLDRGDLVLTDLLANAIDQLAAGFATTPKPTVNRPDRHVQQRLES